MNKVRDYQALEREFITGTMSIRELCRSHGISAHSSVVTQAKKLKWQEKREAYRAQESEAFMSRYAERMADRLAEVRDKALDAIEEAIDKFSEDLHATKLVRQRRQAAEAARWGYSSGSSRSGVMGWPFAMGTAAT